MLTSDSQLRDGKRAVTPVCPEAGGNVSHTPLHLPPKFSGDPERDLPYINHLLNMTPTLCILAAGMGSRYGGLKQLDGVGPDGETIMDYSVFDAARAGFGRVVFVIRRDFEADFRARVLSRYADHIPTEVVFQSMDDLPDGTPVAMNMGGPSRIHH